MDIEEKLFLTVVVALSVAMFAGSYWYSTVEATMPRAAALIVVVFAGVILVTEYTDVLPSTGGGGPADVGDDLDVEREDPFAVGRETAAYSVGSVAIPFRVVVGLLLTGYLVAGFLFGLFWSSLLFVLLYARLTGIDRWRTVGLLVATFVVLYVFGAFLDVPVTDAYLLEVLP